MLAENTITDLQLGGFVYHRFGPLFGLREIRAEAQSARIKLGRFKFIVCFLGGAEIRQQRPLPTEVEGFIKVCRTFAPRARIIMTGPTPGPLDDPQTILQMRQGRNYVENRLSAEKNFKFCRTAERWATLDGKDTVFMDNEGLTHQGLDMVRQDLLECLVD